MSKYQQKYLLTPLCRASLCGLHESQSRIYENQLAGAVAFSVGVLWQMRDALVTLRADEKHSYRIVNRYRMGYIRTESG